MSEGPAGTGKPRSLITWALWGAALLGVAAFLYIIAQSSTKQAPTAPTAAAPPVTPLAEKVTYPQAPTPAPDHVFYDGAGKPVRIADFKGKVVVMNIWATWCAPCVLEMPTLAALQKTYAGKPVKVVAVSVDQPDDAAKAQAFIAKHAPLDFYIDRERKISFVLTPPAPGIPTTVIYGPDGVERARLAGEADWTSPEAKAVIDAVLAGG